MKREKLTIDYDEGADVLYLSFGEPRKAVTNESGDVGIRVDEETHEVVGITVLNFLRNFKKKHIPIKVEV